MRDWHRTLVRGLGMLAIAAAAAMTPRAWAEDVIHLKNGTVLRGEIEREMDGWIWFKRMIGDVQKTEVISPDQIDSIERDAVEADPQTLQGASGYDAAQAQADRPRDDVTINRKTVRGAVVTLEGDVGTQFAVKPLQDILPILEQDLGTDGSGVLVLKINSPGGALLEMLRLVDFVETELKPRFRTVAWIESAISAAAMSSYPLEEIYFLPEGNLGACTGWYGALKNVEGRGLEEVLQLMERVSAQGGRDYRIMRAMQIEVPLSATIEENGEVNWYQTTDGQYVVNPAGKILTFNSQNALQFGFSGGTARNLKELQQLMEIPEIEWIGKEVSGELYPISRAEEKMRTYREEVTRDEGRFNTIFNEYQQAVSIAARVQLSERGKFVSRARTHLDNIKRMVRINPNFLLFELGVDSKGWEAWLDDQEKLLSDLMRA